MRIKQIHVTMGYISHLSLNLAFDLNFGKVIEMFKFYPLELRRIFLRVISFDVIHVGETV